LSNELNICLGVTGLTVTAQLYTAGAASGGAIAMTEIGTSTVYTGTMTGAAAIYGVAILVAGVVRGFWQIIWDGTVEVTANAVNVSKINAVSTSAVTTIKAVQGLTTADTIATYTGNTPQTANVATLITTVGAAGAGLTALGDTRIANLDAAITTRTKPADTQAAVTLVTTTTTLTNLPAATTDWLTAAGVKADAVTKIQAGLSTYAGGAVASVTGTVGGIAGTTQTLDALQTAVNSTHGAGSWATATGFATPTNITAASGVALAASQHVIVDSGTVTTATTVTNDVGITQAGADKVWGTAARVLTAGTNIALAKGVGLTGLNDIAAGAAMTLTGAYDAAKTAATQTSVDDLPTNSELATALGTSDDATLAQIALVKAKTDNLPASPASTTNITAANVNVAKVNGVTVAGAGVAGDIWRAA